MHPFLDVLTYRFLKTLVVILQRIPNKFAIALGRGFGKLVFYFSNRRRVAYADIKAAFGNRYNERERWRIVRNHFANMGEMGIEIVRFPQMDSEFFKKNVHWHTEDLFHETVNKDKGVVLLTAHFGNWELIHMAAVQLGGPVLVLERSQKHKQLNKVLNEFRGTQGSGSRSRGMGMRDLLKALKGKESIALLGDQDAGKHEGIILPFLGRKTTVPTGPFELARRTGAIVLPGFMVRDEKGHHHVYVQDPIEKLDSDQDIEAAAKQYLEGLEKMIVKYPSLWLWGTKRWKYSWTKRLVILSDGKAGHLKQSQALAARFLEVEKQFGRDGMEYPIETIQVEYKSSFHRKIFPWFAFVFHRFAQGRLSWLGLFFKDKTQRQIRDVSADFVISAGSALTPLNVCLARESRGKSIVLMKPDFPFTYYKYDLAVIPAHDGGRIPEESFRTILTPSEMNRSELVKAKQSIESDIRDPSKIKFAIFLGGPTRQYRMNLADIEKVMAVMGRLAPRWGDYVLTTSRRTPDIVCTFLKERIRDTTVCQMLVIAAEDSRSEVVNGMMGLAEILIVTEDSISMISEAVASGKKVIILSSGGKGLPEKHRRFQDILVQKSIVTLATPDDLAQKIAALESTENPEIYEKQNEALRRRLESIL